MIYVDFTARWCATCQTNKKIVFTSDAVLREFAAKKIVTLRADWTNKDPAITTEIAPLDEYFYAEEYHQQYLGKNPNGYCGMGGTGVSCPIGYGEQIY
jgi:peptide methionine sulfoxide reductase MsrA